MTESRPVTVNAADAKKLAPLERLLNERRRAELNRWRVVLRTKEGRAVLWSLIKYCRVLQETWRPGFDADVSVYHAAGVQSVGFHIMAELGEADPDVFLTMMRESKEQARRDSVTAEAVQTDAAGQDESTR